MRTRRQVVVTGLALAAGAAASREARAEESAPARYAKAAQFSEENGGNAMLVLKDGEIVYEHYIAGHTGDTPNFLASATKSFWGVAAAAMIGEGLISSFDELAADTLTEWKADARKAKITLRQILSLTSGLHNDIAAIQGEGNAPNKFQYAVGASLDDDPGTAFTYGPVNFYVFGEIARRKLEKQGLSPLDYLRKRIFEPIGLEYGKWTFDEAGNPHIPNGAYVAAREWIKFGRLVLDKGVHEGQALVPADRLAECFAPNAVNPGYGLTWWLNRPGGRATRGRGADPAGPGGFLYRSGYPDIAGAMGAGPNNLYVLPSLGMAVVRQCPAEIRPANRTWEEQSKLLEARRGRFNDNTFLSLLLTGAMP
ncbi:MAG: serine hydrolase [Alphaproteobacteria bacterium]|nr:serine hydrolase [Alphaproteobacteria bacterium]